MATRELAEIKDKNGDVNELRDKKLADSIAKNTVVNTDNVRMVDTNGKEVFIARDSFISAIRNVLGGFILSNTKAEAPNIPVFDSNGDFGAITAANLASVLGVVANPKETVNISLTQVGGSSADLIGASVTITNDDTSETLLTAAWNGSTITTEIPMLTYYTVSVENIEGYLACEPQSYQAGYQTERNISFQYRAIGAFVEATDGTLYTAAQWASSGKTANSVVLFTSQTKFRIALVESNMAIHSANGSFIGYLPALSLVDAMADFDGYNNTEQIIKFNAANGTNNPSYAAQYCKEYTFPDGTNKGYVMSAGQLNLLILNKVQISECLSACGGTELHLSEYYYSSTVQSETSTETSMWISYVGNGNWGGLPIGGIPMCSSSRVRPVSNYE